MPVLTTPLLNKARRMLSGSSLKARFIKGAFWSMVATGIGQGFVLLAALVVARLLGKEGFGELSIIQSTIGTFGVFAGMGLGLTATKHVAEYRANDPARAGRVIGLTTVGALMSAGALSALVFVLAPWLTVHTLNAPHLTLELQIGCGLLLFNAVNGTQVGALAGFEAFRAIATTRFWQGVLNFPLVWAGVTFLGLRGAVLGFVVTAALGCVINHLAVEREAKRAAVPVRYRGFRAELPMLWGFSLPALLSNAMNGPVIWCANTMLVNRPDGYLALGAFTAASRFNMILTLVGSTAGSALLPMLASKDGAQSERFNRSNMLITWLLGVVTALPLLCFPEVMGLLFGAEFSDRSTGVALIVVMLYSCISLYKLGLGRVLVVGNLLWWSVLSNAMWAAVLLGSAWYLLRWGAVGMALAYLVAYLLNTVVFIPLYLGRKLVPRGTIISWEAALIWGIIAILAALSLLQAPLLVRLAVLLLSIAPMYLAFRRLLN